MHQNRQLAAILFTDIVGYTAMMQQDEQIAVAVNKHYVAVLKQATLKYGGEILNDYGDGSLCTFTSATQAVNCAVEMQQALQTAPKVPLRIGLHVGEIFFEDGKVFGDGVNVASRIQSLGVANSILFSSEINSKLKNQQEFKNISIGWFEFKNVDEPMEIFGLANYGLVVPRKEDMSGKLKEIQKKPVYTKWILAACTVLLLTAFYFIYQKFSHVTGFSGSDKTIAVLPFENTGSDHSEEYISDGITQDIINNLSKISSLQKVIGWFSVRGLKKTTKTFKQIADELGVAAILSGTMHNNEGKTRIIAELIEVGTNKRLWGDDFEYESKDILSIQSKVAGEIVAALRINLTAEEKKGLAKQYTENNEAYRYYLRGRSFWDKRNRETFDSAEANYNKALQLDPNYALAYAGLADLYIFNQKGLKQTEAIPIAKDYVNKALSLDSTLGEALSTLGLIQFVYDYDWAKSKSTLEKAIGLNPNFPFAHIYYGNLLQYTGESTVKGINEIKKALSLDPVSVSLNWVLGRNYWLARQYDLAYGQIKKTLTLNPNYKLAKGTLALVLLGKKNYPEAFKVISELDTTETTTSSDWHDPYHCYALALSGDITNANYELNKTLLKNPGQRSFILSRIYIALHDYDKALNRLEQAYKDRDLTLSFLNVDPTFDPIRNEPRFKALLKKMNLN